MAFQVRHDTAANWASANPILALGELGYDTTNKKVKVGDGATAWASLAYQSGGGIWGQITGTLANQTDLNSALGGKAPTSHNHAKADITDFPTLGTAATLDAPASGDAAVGQAVKGSDTRLTNSRTPSAHGHQPTDIIGTAIVEGDVRLTNARVPISHQHPESDIPNLGTDLAAKSAVGHSHVAADVQGTAVLTGDTRLSDSRPPTAHQHPESDVTNLATDLAGKVGTGDSRLTDARTPVSHDNSKHTVGVAGGASAPGDAAAEGSSASIARADHKHGREAFGTGSGTICQGNDGRLSDARTPLLAFSTLANGATAMALGTYDAVKVTPTVSASYTTTVPGAGKIVTIMILTSGTTAYTITFSTGFKTTGTLSTGTTTARIFCITFRSDGTSLYEIGRTAAMAA